MTHATTSGQHAVSLGPSRTRVLAGLQATAGDLGAVELAERLALHPNSVRYHLDALHRAGLVERRSDVTGRRGRPQLRYRAAWNLTDYWIYLFGPIIGALIAVGFEYILKGKPTKAGAEAAQGILDENTQGI